jgi:hypothetical protein
MINYRRAIYLCSSFAIRTTSSTINKTPAVAQIHIGHIIIASSLSCLRSSFHVATALVVSLLAQLAIELAAFHVATALVHGPACYPAGRFLLCAKCSGYKQRSNKANA